MDITQPTYDYTWGDLLTKVGGPEGIRAGQLLLISTTETRNEENPYFISLLKALTPAIENPNPHLMCVYARTDASGLVIPSIALAMPSYQPVISPQTNVNTFIEGIDFIRKQGFTIGLIAIDTSENFTLDDNTVEEYNRSRHALRELRNYAVKIRAAIIVTGRLDIPEEIEACRSVWDINEAVKKGLYRHQYRLAQEADIEMTVLKDASTGELHVDVAKWRNRPSHRSGETPHLQHLDELPFYPHKD